MTDTEFNLIYEQAFRVKFRWENMLPPEVYNYHLYTAKEISSPVELQMGFILPLIATCCGPRTRVRYFTSPGPMNLYWCMVAASGTGKSHARQKMITEPLEYLHNQPGIETPTFDLTRFTRAGIEDYIIASNGYAFLVTDEATTFFDDIKRKESKHESDLALLNQLYDGKGDKTILAGNKERVVPANATSISIAVQQATFCKGLAGVGSTLWMDSGFGERFLMTAVHPRRSYWSEISSGHENLRHQYDPLIICKIVHAVFSQHHDTDVCYDFTPEARRYLNNVMDRLAAQFNAKWNEVEDSDMAIDPSQPSLNAEERMQIDVRTKSSELIGRLSAVLWVYCQTFIAIKAGRPVNVGHEISVEYVKRAEDIVSVSYSHAEVFTSALFSKSSPSGVVVGKGKFTNREKIAHQIVRTKGMCVPVRVIAKNIKTLHSLVIHDELEKMASEGLIMYKSRKMMEEENLLPKNRQTNVVIKYHIDELPQTFWGYVRDPGCTDTEYHDNYKASIPSNLKDIVAVYYKGPPKNVYISLDSQDDPTKRSNSAAGDNLRKLKEFRDQRGRGGAPPLQTALDRMLNTESTDDTEQLPKDGMANVSEKMRTIEPSTQDVLAAGPSVGPPGGGEVSDDPPSSLEDSDNTYATKTSPRRRLAFRDSRPHSRKGKGGRSKSSSKQSVSIMSSDTILRDPMATDSESDTNVTQRENLDSINNIQQQRRFSSAQIKGNDDVPWSDDGMDDATLVSADSNVPEKGVKDNITKDTVIDSGIKTVIRTAYGPGNRNPLDNPSFGIGSQFEETLVMHIPKVKVSKQVDGNTSKGGDQTDIRHYEDREEPTVTEDIDENKKMPANAVEDKDTTSEPSTSSKTVSSVGAQTDEAVLTQSTSSQQSEIPESSAESGPSATYPGEAPRISDSGHIKTSRYVYRPKPPKPPSPEQRGRKWKGVKASRYSARVRNQKKRAAEEDLQAQQPPPKKRGRPPKKGRDQTGTQ